ncbi:MAG: SDR family NAD(P)-dependent oxidoreductase [Maricaulaceae bacterium]
MSTPKPRPQRPKDGVAWITGASSGIGQALAKRLAKDGWRVALSARSEEKLNRLAETDPERFRAFPLDVSDPTAVADTARKIDRDFGPLARVIFNAGVYLPVEAEKPDFKKFKTTFEVNVLGVAAGLAAVNPIFAERQSGQILIVSSATGFGGMPTASAYGASKAALINMAECLRIELDRWGVLVQLSTPGFVETPAQDDNAFPKPFMVSPETAADRLAQGMDKSAFEISFPRRFTWTLKGFYGLPRSLWLPLVRKQTGWDQPLTD